MKKTEPSEEAMEAAGDIIADVAVWAGTAKLRPMVARALDAFAARHRDELRKFKGRVLEALTPGAGFEPLDDDEIIKLIGKLREGAARAVAEEREACAAIADTCDGDPPYDNTPEMECCQEIAAAIRERGKEKPND